MRYKDLIREWVKIGDQHFVMPNFDINWIHSGKLTTKDGNERIERQVYEKVDQEQKAFILVDKNIPIVYLGLRMFDNIHAMAKNICVDRNFQNKGLATALVDFVVRTKGHKLFSDTEMTEGGESLWLKLIKKSKMNSSIIDLTDETRYELSDIGKSTPYGGKVIAPENDNRKPPENLGNIQPDEQSFFYLLESEKQNNLKRKRTSRFGIPNKIFDYNQSSLLQEINPHGTFPNTP